MIDVPRHHRRQPSLRGRPRKQTSITFHELAPADESASQSRHLAERECGLELGHPVVVASYHSTAELVVGIESMVPEDPDVLVERVITRDRDTSLATRHDLPWMEAEASGNTPRACSTSGRCRS